ncbi:MAG: phosphatidylserine synthase [Flavobacteriia bacterium]|nr:MAG: phosphatidylserine synthase [Flavobacteriia bacterium]
MKKQIPNLLTLLNLLSGLIAVIMACSDRLIEAAFFVMLGIFFDFFDGFFARLLKVSGELGKQLDSLADMVTSGVAPGIVMFQMLLMATGGKWFMEMSCEYSSWQSFDDPNWNYLPFLGLLIPLASAYRLAKFNIDERQTSSFIGLPTPALSLFVVSLPLVLSSSDISFFTELLQNKYVLIGITLIGSYLLNAEIPLFSLKFKDYSWKNNIAKYVFLMLSVVLIIWLRTVAVPLIIISYVLISMIENMVKSNYK